ncbi:hypothetical protein AtubIFM61612_005827 [Aspergillus tubingensis]|nr:hypothetical protein AtubIFM61612_005827 [Aspergillus tubingensis]
MLSMLLLRPPSLPRLKLNPASLIPMESGALSLIVKTVVELAQIQEAAMEVVHRNHGLSDISDVDTTLDAAIQNLASLRGVIDEVEWIATEFRYHAIMATLLHLSPRVQAQPQAREECLVQARHAFQALRRLHKLLNEDDSFVEAEVSIPQIDADNYFYDSATRIGNVDDGAIDPNMVSSWNNAQMWELFGVQSSLEWVDSEVSHAMPERYQ